MGFLERRGLGVRRGFGSNSKFSGGFVGLLDLYPNAAFAASVRLLRADYAGGLLRARANDGTTDQGEADILPYDDGVNYDRFVSLDSRLINLDATAVTRGLTTSDTLGDLLDVGTGNYDGFVPTWYGQQAGSSINAVQATASQQPKIATAGALEIENGRPVLVGDAGTIMRFPSFSASNYQISVVGNSAGGNGAFVSGGDANNRFDFGVRTSSDTRILVAESGSTQRIDSSNNYTNQQILLSGNNSVLNVNGAQINTGAITNSIPNSTEDFALFKRFLGSITGGAEKLQEVIFYDSDKESSLSGIESNINNAFSIY